LDYAVPQKTFRTEQKIKNSRFIATAAYTPSVDEAKEFIASMKREFKDASHNVPAYIVGNGASVIEHCNDDGEPSGTAGRPILAVLKGSGLGDITVVVTRYFGGTKLGTGGLVQAYSSAVKDVLSSLPVSRKTIISCLSLEMPYSHYEPVRRAAESENGTVSNEVFAADVCLDAAFDEEGCKQFKKTLSERWPVEVSIVNQKESVGTVPY